MKHLVTLLTLLTLITGLPLFASSPYELDCGLLLAASSNNTPAPAPKCNDFILLTVPKSGTHLMAKLLVMLTGRYPRYMRNVTTVDAIKDELNKAKAGGYFLYHHTGNFLGKPAAEGEDMGSFLTNNMQTMSNHVKIMQIRDLRDSFVSLVNYLDKRSPGVWARNGAPSNPTFGDKLTIAISTMLKADIKNSLAWVNNPDVVVVRFEDVIGTNGGGSAEVQRNTITNLANVLGINLTAEKLQNITQNLFGISSGPKVAVTFHQGKIGAWKQSFGPEHVKLFNDTWGYYQKALGYPLAE